MIRLLRGPPKVKKNRKRQRTMCVRERGSKGWEREEREPGLRHAVDSLLSSSLFFFSLLSSATHSVILFHFSCLHPLFASSLLFFFLHPHSLTLSLHLITTPRSTHNSTSSISSSYSSFSFSLSHTIAAGHSHSQPITNFPMRRHASRQGSDARDATRSSYTPPSVSNLFPLILVATSVILSTNPTTFVSAQSPQSTCCMSYASLDEKTLYIQGGYTTVGTVRTKVNQFIALDLTVPSWSTSSPPWMTPPYRAGIAPNSSWHSMAVSKDHASLFIWDPFNTGWSTFNIADRAWTNTTLPLDATRQIAIRSAVDYNTGYVYAPAGTSNGTQMAMNTLSSDAYTTSAMPTDLMPVPINHETFVWSTVRGAFLHYGGRSIFGDTANPYLNEYSPTNGWSRVVCCLPYFLLNSMDTLN